MTDPKRLLAEGSEAERRLLAAASNEEPPRDGAKRLALALGLATATVGTAASAKASSGALSKWMGTKLALKAGLVLGAGAALAITLSLRTPVAPAVPHAARPRALPPHAVEPSSEGEREQLPDADRAPVSIADEVARLDAARAALAERRPERALATLVDYARSYPRGTLAPEAARLRIEALLAKGDVPRARALAQEFLRSYPNSPHTAALRQLAQGQGSQGKPHDETRRTP